MGVTMKAMICAALLLSATVGAGQAATITNGSFENGIDPGGFTTVEAGDNTSINGWTVGGVSVDYIGTYWQAAQGVRSIDMSGNGMGSISTLITNLIAGVTYKITFAISGNPDDLNPAEKVIGVGIGEANLGEFGFTAVADSKENMGWVDRVASFTANATSMTLRFFTVSPNNAFGPALDNVRISAVPVPASGLLVFGALAGLALLRRRKAV